MGHAYNHLRERHPGQKRAKEMHSHFKRGGKVDGGEHGLVKKVLASHKAEHSAIKAEGKASGGRLDKRARGGAAKKHGKGHHTHINIMVAPKGGDGGAPPPAGLGAGGPPMGGTPPMVPKAPMAPPGGALGAGPPGMPPGMPPPGAGGPKPPMPGMMKRGGKTSAPSGLSSKANIEKWAARTSSNTKYAKGGMVHMTAGAATGEGRLEKKRAYGAKAKGD